MNPTRALLKRRPILTAVAYTVVGVFPLYLTAAQSVRLQTELGFGRPQFGLVVASFYLVSAIASKRLGPILDRRGPLIGFRLSGVITIVATTTAGLSSSGWAVLAGAMALAGLANAFGQIAANLAIATVVVRGRTGVAFAAKQAAVPVGAMLAGLAVPWVSTSVSWRVPYLIAAAVGLWMALIAPDYDSAIQPMATTRHRLTPAIVALMVTAGIGGGIGNSLASFVTDASVTKGLTQTAGARLLTVGSIIAIATRIAIGIVADRRQRSGVLELVSLLGVAVAGLTMVGMSTDSDGLFIAGVLLGFAGSWGWQGVLFYTVIRTIRMPAATATGAVAAGVYFGTMVMPPLIGFGVERSSYETVFSLAALLIVAGIGLVLLSFRLSRRELSELVQPER
jgi:MFS family permease